MFGLLLVADLTLGGSAASRSVDTIEVLGALTAIVDAALGEVSPEIRAQNILVLNATSFAVLASEASNHLISVSDVRGSIGYRFEDVPPGSAMECMERTSSESHPQCSTPQRGIHIALNGLVRLALGYEVTVTARWTRQDPQSVTHMLVRTIRFLLRHDRQDWEIQNRTVVFQAFY
jgi:hypothetical protein